MTEYNRIFVDTAPLIYFLENDANFGETSKTVFTEILSTGKRLITSAVTCEEYLVHPYKTGDSESEEAFFEFIGRLMNNVKMGFYPTDPDNIALMLRGIRFPEGVTTNLLDPCCGCGAALKQLAVGNNCYTYGVELDEGRAEEAQKTLHRVGFGSFFYSTVSREAFHLLFLNPPYLSVLNQSGSRSRHEKRFLIESMPALAYGGLLIYVIAWRTVS